MGSLKLTTASSGSVILSPANTASDVTITVPASTATMAIDGPAFSAYASANQTISNNTATKIQLDSEVFDTASCFNTSNYRFTPNVAGYYQINAVVLYYRSPTFSASTQTKIWKNGSEIKTSYGAGAGVNICSSSIADCIYMNGTTDYIELYTAQSSGGNLDTAASGQVQIFMSGFLARAA